jgi:putative ABC transport system substrate-binding protein
VNRREFISLLGGAAAAWPLAARAQQGERMRRMGVLMAYAESDREGRAWVAAFREGLQKLGWTEGRTVRSDYRWATSDVELMQRFAKELVGLQPDLILSQNTPTTRALLQQTHTIPIIFAQVADPVGDGFIASLPRPGGNVTGFIGMEAAIAGKWPELLKEIAPRVTRVSRSCSTQQRLPTAAPISWSHSRPPLRRSGWTRSQPPFTTAPNSNQPSSRWHASRMVALS